MPQTGPKSAAGKAKVSRNAIKHGMSANAPCVDGLEDEHEWELHLAGYRESLRPEGYAEQEFADRIASLAWRLRRVVRHETEIIVTGLNRIPQHLREIAQYSKTALNIPIEESYSQEAIEQAITVHMLPDVKTLPNIMRYEAHLHRQMIQTLHELEAMQARRRGERTPLARLDITGAPGS